ncbi:SubName: Full=Uncharacterized protein {ECO:0000313/EMBL:CCA66396.1} [Serendipita indica DSM 11827]|uniref:Uncharacterized protein n=1 Tax=Serendipita indica (strain DSM 11827) TaxID=1109443 RepID=G4T4X3_SERID|nr:SubName: Full=Uncharacterized protein {ECO:0000313/EMBL:CCA66396.1} [Serendipita indica DSM 11827]CCA66396.1 hypothetical protein PIIN_00082 [Serendipita indica DSM 11827]
MIPSTALAVLTLAVGYTQATRLQARQSGGAVIANLPSSCSDICSVFSTLQASIEPSKLCTSTNSANVKKCADCILLIGGDDVLNNDSLMGQTQRAVNSFVTACRDASLPIPGILIANPLTQNTTTPSSANSGYHPAVDSRVLFAITGAVGLFGSYALF